jgi:hypothetical protein
VDNLKTGYQRTVDQFADFDRQLNEKKYGYQGFDESGLKLRDIYSAKELGDLVLKNKREGWNGLGERQQAENFKNIVAALRGGFVNPSPTYVNRVPGGGTFKK